MTRAMERTGSEIHSFSHGAIMTDFILTYLPFYLGQGSMMSLAKVDQNCIKSWLTSVLRVNTIFGKGAEAMVDSFFNLMTKQLSGVMQKLDHLLSD